MSLAKFSKMPGGHTYRPWRQAQKKEGWISGVLERSCVLELSGQSRHKHRHEQKLEMRNRRLGAH